MTPYRIRIALSALWLGALALPATAQLQLTPQPQQQPAKKSESGVKKRQESKKAAPKKESPKAESKSDSKAGSKSPTKNGPAATPAVPDDPNVDLAYGAYQRYVNNVSTCQRFLRT